jgi:glycosyltransferase involved in cell wall biosynthesis
VTRVAVAANRGDIGGGELMLLRLAPALADLGYDVTVVAPGTPGDLAHEATARGLHVEALVCRDRKGYARALRRWDRDRREEGRGGLLWCNGLLPAWATSGRPNRIVHLHQQPPRWQLPLAVTARRGALVTLVPSSYLAGHVPGSQVLPNWTDDLGLVPRLTPHGASGAVTIGALGRVSKEKGTVVLAQACRLLPDELRPRVRLVVAGDDRFVPAHDRQAVAAALAQADVLVEQPGWVAPRAFFADVDLAVFPSVRPESFGLVAAEAMAAGRPVVVSDAGGLPEVVGPGHPWIAARGDAVSLARTIAQAVAALPATELAHRLRARWEQEYSPSAGQRHLAELLARLRASGLIGAAS